MKKIIKLLIMCVITMCVFVGISSAVSAATSGDYTYTISNGEVTITDCSYSLSGDVVIPSAIEGYPVRHIGENAFSSNSKLRKITIPNSVTSIGDVAFGWCNKLEEVIIPDSVTSIGDDAFAHCELLENVSIGNGVISIGNSAFIGCSGLTSITIPNSVTSIDDFAFRHCSGLTQITIPDSVSKMGIHAFAYCTSLQDVTIGSGIKNIGNFAFGGCVELTNIIIPNNVTTIGNDAFYDCDKLTSITIPNSVTSIGDGVFEHCDELISITIGEGISTVGEGVFASCPKFSFVVYAEDEQRWKTIKIGGNNSVLNRANKYYNSFTVNTDNGFYVIDKSNCILKYVGSDSGLTIPNNIMSIGDNAFYDCDSLTNISVPDSVISIGDGAFSYCELLENVSIGNGVTSIGNDAFLGCSGLTNLTLGNSVKNIGNNAFYDCDSLTNIGIPDSVISIGNNSFYGCDSLTQILVGDNNKNYCDIDGVLFDVNISTLLVYPSGKTNALYTIPNGVLSIATDAFLNNNSIKNLKIPDSITTIPQYIGNSIEEIIVDDNNKVYCDINGVLFNKNRTILIKYPNGNTNDSYIIPRNVESISNYAFCGSNHLTEIILPHSISNIGDYAFYNCYNMVTVKYSGTASEFGSINIGIANSNITGLQTIYCSYIEIYDFSEKLIFQGVKEKNISIDIHNIISSVIEDGCAYNLYEDNKKINRYNEDTTVTSDLVLYIDVFEPNLETISITGRSAADIGETITETVHFATDKEIYYMLCNIRYPESLKLNKVVPVDFNIVESGTERADNGYTILPLTCIYNTNGDNISKHKTYVPFELIFDISKDAPIGEISIVIEADSEYCGNTINKFTTINNTTIEILPKLAEDIIISGADKISESTKYAVVFTPDYTTNKNVEWYVSDTSIATISQDGTLEPLSRGTITLTVKTLDGSNLSATKTITIVEKAKIDNVTTNIGEWESIFDADTRDYTIYVPFDTTSIDLTASYITGTLKVNEQYAFDNRPLNIALAENITSIKLVRSGVADCIDGEYNIDIIKTKPFTKVTVSEDGKLFSVRAYLVDNDSKIILALYKDKRFITLYDDFAAQGVTIPFTITEDYDTAKVMVWDNWDTLRPLCEVEEINKINK